MHCRRPVLILVLSCVVAAACAEEGRDKDVGARDAGPADASPSEDGGPGDGGPRDGGAGDSGPVPCTFHTDCASDRWCDPATGECRPAYGCADTSTCNYYAVDEPDPRYAYCGTLEYDGCQCTAGHCKPRVPFCHRCTQDSDCPSNFVSRCAPDRPGGVDKYCLPTTANNCGAVLGFRYPSDVGATLCVPGTRTGTCDGFAPCDGQHPCDPESSWPICNDNHVCVPACEAKEDCSSVDVCHLRADLLSTAANWGKGQCGPPCTSDGECAKYGAGLVCMRDPGASSGPKRCRVSGCLDDLECPHPDADGEYCDTKTLTCVHQGCEKHQDCGLSAGGKVQKCNAQKQCEEATCDEAGGNVSCPNPGEFCCGVEGGLPCDPADKGKCLKAPTSVFCQDCKHNDADAPDHHKCSASPSSCDFASGGGAQTWVCMTACQSSNQCPSGWGCSSFRGRLCLDNRDCGSATADGGPGDCNTDTQKCDCRAGATCPAPFTCDPNGGCVTRACIPKECPIP